MILRALSRELDAEALKVAVGIGSAALPLLEDPQTAVTYLYNDVTDIRQLMEMGRTIVDHEAWANDRLTSDPVVNKLIAQYKEMEADGTIDKMTEKANQILEAYRSEQVSGFKPGDKLSWSMNEEDEEDTDE